MSLHRRLSIAVAAALSLAACNTPAQKSERAAFKRHDYSSRQIVGRQTLLLEPGVRIHADRMFTGPSGAIQFKGRIFVDGRAHSTLPDQQAWPTAVYADNAQWDTDHHQLTLTGHLVIQTGKATIEGTQAATKATLNGRKLTINGPARTDIEG